MDTREQVNISSLHFKIGRSSTIYIANLSQILYTIPILILPFLLIVTGKSSAIQHAAQDPLEQLELTSTIISKTTSSGLVKLLANKNQGFILSPEVFDILNKLMKSDEDNATGDVQLLCKLFSGERCSYHYSTEESRVIAANTPFSILGSTQLLNVAKLIAKMDHGHGLVDRFLFPIPLAFRPTLTEMETAADYLSTEVIENFEECFKNIYGSGQLHFTFDPDARELLRENIDQFVAEVNEAIRNGIVPPKSKMPELVPRVAASLHVFNHTMTELLAGVPATSPPTEITKSTLENATEFVHHLESQKDILCQVSTISKHCNRLYQAIINYSSKYDSSSCFTATLRPQKTVLRSVP